MVKISFLGDIVLTGRYNNIFKNGINPFINAEKILNQSDYVVGNLECLAGGDSGENLLKKPRLKTEMQTLNLLKKIHLSLVSLSHNHVYDNLEDGFTKTLSFLKSNNIKFLGAALSNNEAQKPIVFESKGIRIGFLNYVTVDTNPSLPGDSTVFLNWFGEEKIKKNISEIRENVDHIVLLLHWGGDFEGSSYPNITQSHVARRLIDYGADLIIGHHSHTLQPYEIYKEKYIFHSLGNFCFDDFICDGKMNYVWPKRRQNSAIVNAYFSKDKIDCVIQGINNENCFIRLSETKIDFKNKVYKMFFKKSILWIVYKFYFKKIEPYFIYLFNPKVTLKVKCITLWGKIKR